MKKYNKISISEIKVDLNSSILIGSVTVTPMKIGNVEVEEFKSGFNEAGNDFKDIDFN